MEPITHFTDYPSFYPKMITTESMVIDAFNIMEDFSITQLVVADEGEFKGILHLHDILKEGIV